MDLYTIERLALYRQFEMEREAKTEMRRKEFRRQAQRNTRTVQPPRFKRQLGRTLIRAGEWLVKTA
jgi:hypothetical protein